MNKAQATIDKDHLDEFRKARKAASEAYENFLEASRPGSSSRSPASTSDGRRTTSSRNPKITSAAIR